MGLKGTGWAAEFPEGNSIVDTAADVYDFIGPSIDIGFRLSSYSSKRQFVVSLELAYLLNLVPTRNIETYYAEKIDLKGINQNYPLLWFEMGNKDIIDDSSMLKAVESTRIADYCKNALTGVGRPPSHLPFIIGDDLVGTPPECYFSRIEKIKKLRVNYFMENESDDIKETDSSITTEEIEKRKEKEVEKTSK